MAAFLLSVPRSGSTLLSVLLSKHPDVYSPAEPWLLLALDSLGYAPADHPADSKFLAMALDGFLGENRKLLIKDAAEAIYKKILKESGKKLLIDKTPRYYQSLDLLTDVFVDSKKVILLRNPLDVAASYLSTWDINLPSILIKKEDNPFFLDYILGFNYLAKLIKDESIHVIHYESLVKDPQKEMNALCAYLEIEPFLLNDNIDFANTDYSKSMLGDKKIAQKSEIDPSSIGSYEHTFHPDDLSILLLALGKQVFKDLGYESVYEEVSKHIVLDAFSISDTELFDTAESYLNSRKPTVKLQEVNQIKFEKANTEIANLESQLDTAKSEITELTEQLYELNNMGFRARAKAMKDYLKKRIKNNIYSALWRIASGKSSSPLPKITVVTPVFNGITHIAETLESVLRQEYPELEYIVVDGGSTDGTVDVIRSYAARTDLPQKISLIISEPDNGMYDAIAKGFEHATGEIYCYLNADDLFECGGLRSVGKHFAENPSHHLIYHEDVVLIDGWKFPNIRQPKNINTIDLLNSHILFQDGVFWRKDAYKAIGGFRRDLRLAGDFDLWLRLSTKFKFIRRSGHVSCFRVRPGQLSSQMGNYHAEVKQSIADVMATSALTKRIEWTVRKQLRIVMNKISLKPQRDRLFFPIDFGNLPPPTATVPPNSNGIPISPIDGEPAERLLFTTPDTRFGERELNYIYLDERHGIAITHPPIAADRLDDLYRKYYSKPPTELKLPTGTSPYRQFNGKSLWEKVLLTLPVEKLAKFFPNSWGDNTLAELTKVLLSSKVNVQTPLRFLDTGCFEGNLLDQIKARTSWVAFGLEPNEHAVEVASSKGHKVWQGHAEFAVEIIPQNQQFDVIFMGQSIEHVDDPVRVLRRLRLLLAPGGILVMSTPNLDSREIDWFGPTWAHWHPPYHRHIFSRKGLISLAKQVGMLPIHFKSFSHPYWTTMSIAHNWMGLGGSASHAVNFDPSISIFAQRINFWQKIIWNRLGKGDYCFISIKDGAYE